MAPLALQNKKIVYDLLFPSSAETLLEIARDPRHRGAEIGFFSGPHTWNQKLGLHPHVPCVLPAGGLSLDHTHWVKSRYRFFLPSQALRRVFRSKCVAALQQAFHDNPLVFPADLPLLAPPKLFAAWLRPLFRKDGVRPASAAGRLRSNGFIESAPEHPATIATLPGSALPIKH
jgi:hypothetical protein